VRKAFKTKVFLIFLCRYKLTTVDDNCFKVH